MIATTPSRESEALARVRRLKSDFAFWARCCYRIKNKDLILEPFVQRPLQARIREHRAKLFARYRKALQWILKGRQGGVSTQEQAENLFEIWRREHADVLTLADSKDNTGKIFNITRRAIENFPPALLPERSGADTFQVSFTKRDSNFWTATAGGKTPGRGATLVRIHMSEFAWYGDPKGTLAAVAPGSEGVPGRAIVLESTPSAYGSEPHLHWQKTQRGETGFHPFFVPWWECDPPRYRTALEEPDELGPLTEHEASLVAVHGLDLEQIKWRREQIAFYSLGEFLKEYPEDPEGCWLVAGDPFYNRETLLVLAQRTTTPSAYIPAGDPTKLSEQRPRPWLVDRPDTAKRDGEVWIYGEPAPSDRGLILGADTAEGVGQDRSTYVMRSYPSWRLIEEFASSTIEPKPFAKLIDDRSRGRRVFLVIERNLHGTTVLRELRDAGYDRRLIYHRAALDDRNPEERSDRMGWHTNASSYGVLLDAGRDLLHEAREGNVPPPSADTIRDAFAVQRDKEGRVNLSGRDLLVAELLAWIGRTAPRP